MSDLTENEEELGFVFDLQHFAEGDGEGEGGEGGGEGEGGENKSFFEDGFGKWTAALPEDMQKDERLKGMKSPGEAVKKYFELDEKEQSREKPPKTPEGYRIKDPDYPEGLEAPENYVQTFREVCLEAGISRSQAVKIFDKMNKVNIDAHNARVKQSDEKTEELKETLKEEWKGDYDKNMVLVERAIKTFGEKELGDFIKEKGLGDNPYLIKAFYKIGMKIGEDQLVLGTSTETKGTEGKIDMNKMFPSMKDMPDRQ